MSLLKFPSPSKVRMQILWYVVLCFWVFTVWRFEGRVIMRHRDPLKCREQCSQWHRITSQKTWSISSAAVGTLEIILPVYSYRLLKIWTLQSGVANGHQGLTALCVECMSIFWRALQLLYSGSLWQKKIRRQMYSPHNRFNCGAVQGL
jgi:hypothetical protein